MEIRVADADDLHQFANAATVHGVDLHEEAIHDLLRLFRRQPAFFQIVLQVRPRVLIEAAERSDIPDRTQAQDVLICDRRLAGLAEGAARVLGDPVQAVCHGLQFSLALLVGA